MESKENELTYLNTPRTALLDKRAQLTKEIEKLDAAILALEGIRVGCDSCGGLNGSHRKGCKT